MPATMISFSNEIARFCRRHFRSLRNVSIAVLGIAFKPDTDDVRESPAFPLIRQLKAAGAHLTYDPVAQPAQHEDLAGVRLARSMREAVVEAEIVGLVTRWAEFSGLADVLHSLGNRPLVVDGRRVLDPRAFERYEGIGR